MQNAEVFASKIIQRNTVLTRENYGLLSTKYSTTKKKQTNVVDKVQKKLGSAAILLTLILLTH